MLTPLTRIGVTRSLTSGFSTEISQAFLILFIHLLLSTEMDFLRRAARISRIFKARNEIITEKWE
jgi:hypothetical protein